MVPDPIRFIVSTHPEKGTDHQAGGTSPVMCPRCDKDFVQRVSRQGVIERAGGLFFFYPFLCQLCGHRFKRLQWGTRYVKTKIDRRQYERMSVTIPAVLSGESVSGEGLVNDLSIAGCRLSTEAQVSEGHILCLELQPSDAGKTPIVIEATVVRSVHFSSVGVQFLRVSEKENVRLGRLMWMLLSGFHEKEEPAQEVVS